MILHANHPRQVIFLYALDYVTLRIDKSHSTVPKKYCPQKFRQDYTLHGVIKKKIPQQCSGGLEDYGSCSSRVAVRAAIIGRGSS